MLCVVFATLGGCGEAAVDPYREVFDKAIDGVAAEGYKDGVEAGRREADRAHQGKYALFGLVGGALVGLGVVVFFGRRGIGRSLGESRGRRVERARIKAVGVRLDEALERRVLKFMGQRSALAEALRRSEGPLVKDLAARLSPQLEEMTPRVQQVAALLQGLRDTAAQIGGGEATLREEIEGLRVGGQEEAAEGVARKLAAYRKNQASVLRCEQRLDAVDTFLDHMALSLGNIKALEVEGRFDDSEGQAAAEVDALVEILKTTIAELA